MNNFYKLANFVIGDGMTEEAFNALRHLCYDLALYHLGTPRAANIACIDLINRTKRTHYPHGYRIEFREGGAYEV